MLIDGIDHIGIALTDELKRNELKHPEYMYFFNYFNVGIEIKRSAFSVVEKHITKDNYYHVVCYNWNPDFKKLKEFYSFDYQDFKNDKWNRRYTIGDFLTLEEALRCFQLVVKMFCNDKLGVLF